MDNTLAMMALTMLRPALTPKQIKEICSMSDDGAMAFIAHGEALRNAAPQLSEHCRQIIDSGIDAAVERAEAEMAFCQQYGIDILTPDNPRYPQRLTRCDDAPAVLYYRGTADLNALRMVCIIGTRKCTAYGSDLIRNFVKDLSELCPGVVIVSGLAYGVDINAHRNALDCGLDTVGVVAHGLDFLYPKMHRDTAKLMVAHGGILTEYPSGTTINRVNFLQRNRIVAGISDACVLPESASHGGGLVTCRLSTEYGREVFAFPGAVGAEYSEGCNNLIRNHGAQLITSAQDFVWSMGWNDDSLLAKARRDGIERNLFPSLSDDAQRIVDCLSTQGNKRPDEISSECNIPIATVRSELFLMEMDGVVQPLAGGGYHLLK